MGSFGGRRAYVGLGLLTLMIAFPAVFLFISEPMNDKATDRVPAGSSAVSQDRLPDLEVREALAGRRFWLIATALMLVSTVTHGMVVHTVPLLTDTGYSPLTAVSLMVAVGLS